MQPCGNAWPTMGVPGLVAGYTCCLHVSSGWTEDLGLAGDLPPNPRQKESPTRCPSQLPSADGITGGTSALSLWWTPALVLHNLGSSPALAPSPPCSTRPPPMVPAAGQASPLAPQGLWSPLLWLLASSCTSCGLMYPQQPGFPSPALSWQGKWHLNPSKAQLPLGPPDLEGGKAIAAIGAGGWRGTCHSYSLGGQK